MLRKRQYDYIYRGLNFHSLLWGLGELQLNKKVLILTQDEKKDAETSSHFGLINYFEYLSFKRKWHSCVGHLSKNNLFTTTHEHFFYGNEILRLGYESPLRNLQELKRKFSSFFPKNTFVLEHFDEIIYRLAKDVFTAIHANLNYRPSKKECEASPIVQFLVELANNIDHDTSSKFFRDCLSPLRFYYLFEPTVKENTFVLLLISLLPRYTFDEDRLYAELRQYFTLAGGEIKETSLERVGLENNLDLLQVRVNSVEGMLLTQSLTFFGAIPEEGILIGDRRKDKNFWSEVCLSIPKIQLDPALVESSKVFLIDDQSSSEEFGPVFLRFKDKFAYFYSFYNARFGHNDIDNRTKFYSYLKSIIEKKFNSGLPALSEFRQIQSRDQLSFWSDVHAPLLAASFKNDPVDFFSKNLFYTGLGTFTYFGMGKLFDHKLIEENTQKSPEKGQTAVEYLLLLLVIATIGFALMKKLNEKLLGNAGDCAQGGDSLICKIQALMNAEGNFKYFRINK